MPDNNLEIIATTPATLQVASPGPQGVQGPQGTLPQVGAGLLAADNLGGYVARSIASLAAALTVTNGSAVAGNVELDLADNLKAAAAVETAGYLKRDVAGDWSTSASVPWADLSNVPATFAPSAHSHPWTDLTGVPATFPPSGHAHPWTDLTGVPATFPPTAHAHAWADLVDVPATFPPAAHTHTWASLTAKPTTLAGFGIADAYTMAEADANYAPAVHGHTWGDISGTPTTLGGYGITDAYTKAETDAAYLPIAGTASNSAQLLGGTWAIPGAIGATTPSTGKFTSVTATATGNSASLVYGSGITAASTGIYFRTAPDRVHLVAGGTDALCVSSSGINMGQTAVLAWTTAAGTPGGAADVIALREASGVLSLRAAAIGQTLRVYQTYTDTSNYQRFYINASASGSALRIGQEAAGTGSFRDLVFQTALLDRWGIDSTTAGAAAGAFYAGTDNAYDIGKSGAGRPRNIFIAGQGTFGGTVGIGVSPGSTSTALQINPPSTLNATAIQHIYLAGNAPSTTTSRLSGIYADLATANAVFTLSSVSFFNAGSLTRGASSTINTVYGFIANNGIVNDVAGSSAYAFYSGLNKGANATVYQLYMVGTAESIINGPLSVGTTLQANGNGASFLYVGGSSAHPNSATSIVGVKFDYTAPSTATSAAYGVMGTLRTAASAFTLSSARYFAAEGFVLGAGSAITTVYGFMARNAIAVGGTNIAFYSDVSASGTATNYQLYMSGTAPSILGGTVTIGPSIAIATAEALRITLPNTMTGTSLTPVNLSITAPATATAAVSTIFGTFATAASVFTLAELNGVRLNQFTLGAGSTLTALNGFYVNSLYTNDVAGTTVRGFYSLLNKGANATVYQLYMGGTAPCFIGANMAIGGIAVAANRTVNAWISTLANSAGTVAGIIVSGAGEAGATSTVIGVQSQVTTAAAAVTYGAVVHFDAFGSALGAGSSVTSMRCFHARNNAAVGVNNYGFYSDINAATANFAFYGAGTADASFGGAVLCRSATAGIGYATGAGGTVIQATNKSTGVALAKNCGQITMAASALAAGTIVSFVVTNASVAATDLVHVQHQSGGTLGAYSVNASSAAGSFTIQVRNNTGASLSEALVLSFAIVKGVTA
jgi:hypothetical protein